MNARPPYIKPEHIPGVGIRCTRWDDAIQSYVETVVPEHNAEYSTDFLEDPESHCCLCGMGEWTHPFFPQLVSEKTTPTP